MPAPRIQADYNQLAQASRLFAQESGQTQALVQQMGQLVQALQGGGWVGRGANAFYAEMNELISPALQRLIGSLEDASSAALRISDIFQQAEQEAARCFDIDGGGGGSSLSGLLGGLFERPEKKGAPGTGVNINNYQDGVNGWNVIPGANRPFVSQVGPRCWLYGPQNAAIAAGYDISQDQANRTANSYSDWNPFWESQQNSILKGIGADFEHRNFSEWGRGPLGLPGTNTAAAEAWLIKNVQAGNPVMVNTATDNTFGIPGSAHAYTVIGVRTDASGRLTSVLVSTNWGSSPHYEIPAASFMADWSSHQHADAIVVRPPAKH